jgi:hypothetical protein
VAGHWCSAIAVSTTCRGFLSGTIFAKQMSETFVLAEQLTAVKAEAAIEVLRAINRICNFTSSKLVIRVGSDAIFDEEHSAVRTGTAPQFLASLRNTAINLHRRSGADNIE